jgi:hypothetical protein
MADSIREKVLKEIFSRISGIPAFASSVSGRSPNVFRSRTEMVARNEMPAAIIQPLNEDATQVVSSCKIDKSLMVVILVCIHADIADQAADPIMTEIHKRMLPTSSGFTNFDLGGLPGVQDVAEAGIQFRLEGYDGTIPMGYVIRYRHSQGDPTVL